MHFSIFLPYPVMICRNSVAFENIHVVIEPWLNLWFVVCFKHYYILKQLDISGNVWIIQKVINISDLSWHTFFIFFQRVKVLIFVKIRCMWMGLFILICVRLLSVLHGHSFSSSQHPADFEGFPSQILCITY